MNITTSTGTMTLDGSAKPSIDDMNDIISSLTSGDDNGAQFLRLCDASTDLPDATNEEFHAACVAWLATHS